MEPTLAQTAPKFFETSDSTDKLDAAIAKAQGEIGDAAKDATNPHFNKSYADLASVREACAAALSKQGVAVTQWPVPATKPNHVALHTRLAFAGQWMRAYFELPTRTWSAQDAGGAITYLRRYTLAAAVGVAPSDDDDGNSANGRATKERDPRDFGGHHTAGIADDLPVDTAPKKPNPIKIEACAAASKAAEAGKNWSAFWAGARDLGWTSEEVHAKAFEDYAVSTLTALNPQQLSALKEFLKANPKVQS